MCELGALDRADGSARWSQDHTTVLAAVYGPRAVAQRKEDAERAVVEVVFKPRNGVAGKRLVVATSMTTLPVCAPLQPRSGNVAFRSTRRQQPSNCACCLCCHRCREQRARSRHSGAAGRTVAAGSVPTHVHHGGAAGVRCKQRIATLLYFGVQVSTMQMDSGGLTAAVGDLGRWRRAGCCTKCSVCGAG